LDLTAGVAGRAEVVQNPTSAIRPYKDYYYDNISEDSILCDTPGHPYAPPGPGGRTGSPSQHPSPTAIRCAGNPGRGPQSTGAVYAVHAQISFTEGASSSGSKFMPASDRQSAEPDSAFGWRRGLDGTVRRRRDHSIPGCADDPDKRAEELNFLLVSFPSRQVPKSMKVDLAEPSALLASRLDRFLRVQTDARHTQDPLRLGRRRCPRGRRRREPPA
jgi:hypothetical protein